MASEHLRRRPQDLKVDIGEAWFYEEGHGLSVVHRGIETTSIIKIPWRKLRKSLERKDRKG